MFKRIVSVGLLVGAVAMVSGATVYVASAQQDGGAVETPAQVQQESPAPAPPAWCGADQETWEAMRADMDAVLGPGAFEAMHDDALHSEAMSHEGWHGAMHSGGEMAAGPGAGMGTGHMGGFASATD